jgi:hypothetical protein
MLRLALLVPWMFLLAFGQESKKEISTIPADRRVDTYAIYSAVLAHPSLSHPDNNEKYLIEELSGYSRENDPSSCITPPESYRASFVELLTDRSEHSSERFRLERSIKISKPYDLVTADQAKQFGAWQMGRSSAELEGFRGAADLITLGNVYFDKKRTMAAAYTWAWCGSLCAYGTWRVFTKDEKGRWDEQHWISCMTIAASRRSR